MSDNNTLSNIINTQYFNRRFRQLIPLKTSYLNLRQIVARSENQFPNVQWLSHHIPKTAGKSLLHSFRLSFGMNHIQEAYSDSLLHKRLSLGKPVWVARTAKVLHGHFSPHENHVEQFPNARRIIWIRDPVERNISLLGHILNHTLIQSRFVSFKTKYTLSEHSFEELFSIMMTDKSLYSATRIYDLYLQGVRKSNFAFVGQVNRYKEDLIRLEEIMGIKLTQHFENVNSTNNDHKIDIQYYKKLLQSEYELLDCLI